MLGPVITDLQSTALCEDEKQLLDHPYLGGIILFSRNYQDPSQLAELVRQIREVRSELLICVDQEGGRVQRFREGFSRLPPLQRLGELYAENSSKALFAAHKCAWLMASEVRAMDIDLSFAPVVDIDARFSDVIGDRSFANRADVVTPLAKAYIRGMADAGMCATLKHFPGHGAVKADSHVCGATDNRSFEEVASTDMRPFVELLGHAAAVMPAHIRYPMVDDNCVGFSPLWLKRVLRQQLQFGGVIFSDDLSMEGAAGVGSHVVRAETALAAGCDSVLVCNAPDRAREVLEALASKRVPRNDVLKKLKPSLIGGGYTESFSALRRSAIWNEAVRIVTSLGT